MASNGLLSGVSEGLKMGLQGFLGERDRRDKLAMALTEQKAKDDEIKRRANHDLLDTQVKIGGLLKDGGAQIAGDKTPSNYTRYKVGDTELAFNPERKKEWAPNPLQEVQYQNAIADLKTKNEKATPVGKYNAMPSEAKGKVGNITNALTALTKTEDAFDSGVGPQYLDSSVPLIGTLISDNDFTTAQRLMNEEVGRLQSGGAISKEELVSFKGMDPRPGDTEDIKNSKLLQKRDWLVNKLNAFGVKKEDLADLGFNPEQMGLLRERKAKVVKSAPPKETLAGPGLLPKSGKPKTVIQNGHTYTLNEKTGEYE